MISDFGLSQSIDQLSKLPRAAGRYIYLAPECFFGTYLPTSDVYSAGIVLYRMITGIHPWEYDFDQYPDGAEGISTTIIAARRKGIRKPSYFNDTCSPYLDRVILKALARDIEERFKTAAEFLDALEESRKEEMAPLPHDEKIKTNGTDDTPFELVSQPETFTSKKKGKGLEMIVGMAQLKEKLFQSIITPLNDKLIYEQYKVSIPNGVLLYGPRGCGKKFIAQKLAEEIEYQFIEMAASAILGNDELDTNKNIIQLFKKAKEMAPTVIFIDDIDLLLPKRSEEYYWNNVRANNELLAQLTDCHQYEIFIISSSNIPEKADNVILDRGKLEIAIYVSPPDELAREELFKLSLGKRPAEFNINFRKLAQLTKRCTANEIDDIVTEASRMAVQNRLKIKQEHFEEVIKNYSPSISEKALARYESFRMEKPVLGQDSDDMESSQRFLRKNSIFISYSHKDSKYLEELKRHFSAYRESLNLWYDTKIKTGEVWEEEIKKALNEAEIAILLLSPDFFYSEFISEYEIPLIKKKQREGLKVIIIVLSPCDIDYFSKYQLLNSIDNPVIEMEEPARERIWLKTFKRVKELLRN